MTISGCGGGGDDSKSNSTSANGDSSETVTVKTNSPPQILSSEVFYALEGRQSIIILEATDKENDPLEFSLMGGADQAHFTLDNKGHLVFKNTPDFELPQDKTADNRYQITVRVSDGELYDDANVMVQVTNALEGRVEGGLGSLADAQLFIDCNADGIKNSNETAFIANEAGYYITELPDSCHNILLVSKSGQDIITGNESNMMLMALVPEDYDLSKRIILNPLTSILTYVDQEDHETVLQNFSIDSLESSSALLSLDPWQITRNFQTATSDNKQASELIPDEAVSIIQKINAQLYIIIKAVAALNGEGTNTHVLRVMADLFSQKNQPIELGNTATLSIIFDLSVNSQVPDAVISRLAALITYLSSTQASMVSDEIIELITTVSYELQNNIFKLVTKKITEKQFTLKTAEDLISIIKLPIAIPNKIDVSKNSEVVIVLEGNNSDGTEAEVFLVGEIPLYGKLKDSQGNIIEPKHLPYRLPDAQVFYTNTLSASSDSLVFIVADDKSKDESLSAKVAINITGTNDRPVAKNSVITLEGSSAESIVLKASDADNDQLSYKIVSLPLYGKLMDGDRELKFTDLNYRLPDDNRITYVRTSSSTHSDSFSFVANDNFLQSKPARVSVNIANTNKPPVIVEQKALTVPEEKSLRISFDDLNVTDSDNIYPNNFTLEISSGENYRVDGELIYPDANYVGLLSVPLKVKDGTSYSQIFNLVIEVTAINDAPQIIAQKIPPSLLRVDEDHSITLKLEHFVVKDVDNSSEDLSLKILSGENYNFKGTQVEPDENYAGTLSIPVMVSDGKNDSTQHTVTISVTAINDPPEIISSDELYIDEEERITLALNHLQVNDVDNNYPADFTLRVLEGDDYIVEGNEIKPYQNYAGTLSIPVVVNDGEDESAQHTVKISVSDINDNPRAFNKTIVIRENDNHLIKLEGEDVEDDANGDILKYEIIDSPEFGKLTRHSGNEFIYTNTSDTAVSDSFTYRAIDSLNAHSNHANVSIIIEPADDIGSVVIHGNPVVGQTLNATVIDDDGYESSQVAYQWRHSNSEDISPLSLSDQRTYTPTENDIGKKISVTATYVDNGGSNNTVSGSTQKDVVPLPVIKKTISITDAQPGREVFDVNQLKDKLMIENVSAYTLKELSIDSLMVIAESELPDTAQFNASSSDASNSDPIYGYTKIEDNFANLEDSTLFQITAEGDIKLTRSPDLSQSYVGSGNKEALIGESHTLGIFSDSKSLQGLINIRFSPSSVSNSICSNPVGENLLNPPVVLVHGWMGFDKAELAPASYWGELDKTLATAGNTQVFSTKVDPWAVPETRGEQLIAYIECVLLRTEKDRVDIIGHSLGSPTARYAAYWLDNHEGHTPKNLNESEVRSVISVSGTNYGGNIRVVDKAHMHRVANKASQLYKANIAMRDFSISELIFKFIDKNEIIDRNTHSGKQYKLAIDLLEELSGDSGLLESVKSTLLTTDTLINKLIANKENDKGIVTQWLGDVRQITWKSVKQDMKSNANWIFWACGRDWKCKNGKKEEFIRMVDDFFDALNNINNGLKEAQKHTPKIEDKIPTIIDGLSDLKIELEELNSQDHDPDYSALLTELEKTQQAVSKITPELTGLKDDINQFATGLNKLATVLQGYKDFEAWYKSWNLLFPKRLEKLIGLNGNQVGQLKDVVGDFYDVMANNLVPLLESSNQLLTDKDLIKNLFSEDEATQTSTVDSIANLFTKSESLVAKFKSTIDRSGPILKNLHPKWGDHFTTSLDQLVDPLTNVKEDIETTEDSIDGIKTMLKVAMGEHNVDWQQLVSWQINEIQEIKSSLISDFLASDAAVNYGLNPTDVKQCLKENTKLAEYYQRQQQSKKSPTADYDLPTTDELTPGESGCATVVNNIINTVVDILVPLNEINPETNKVRYNEISEGFYAVSSFGAQMFNIKYPDTGVSAGRYKDCVKEQDFSKVNYENDGATKYYSIIGKRDYQTDNFSDRIIKNIFVLANNSAEQDVVDRFSDFVANILLINRQGANNPTHDMPPSQVENLLANSDIMVATCSQELGQVISLDNSSYTQNLNHIQIVNQSFLLPFASDITGLISGDKVEGYVSISNELDECNQSNTVTDRKECMADLLARIIIMYATAKAIDGSQIDETTKTLGLFDLIKPLVQDEIEMGGVNDVPQLYESFFQWVQSQN